MPTRYSSSAASSLYPQPLSSRASTATAVVTPLEDFRSSRYVHSDQLAPVDLPTHRDFKVLSNTSSTSSHEYTYELSRRGSDSEPHGPYFSIPLHRSSDKPTIMRRGTTKELIGKYESLSSPPHSARSDATSSKQSHLTTPESSGKWEKRGKGRSPIRQSFRNLFSVFSKKGRHARELLSLRNSPGLHNDGMPVASLLTVPTTLEPLQIPVGSAAPVFGEIACTTPSSLYSGSLLHLSRPSSSEGLPVWANCQVILHPSHILVTWMSSHGNPSTSIITLPQCTDIRSLTVNDLGDAERDLLPMTAASGGLKIFELLFEGKSREKFAASSIKERAGWVGAIWDAVLKISEEKTYTPSINTIDRGSCMVETPVTPNKQPSASDITQFLDRSSNASMIGTPNGHHSQQSPTATIPRVSQPKSPVRITLYDPPVPKPTPPLPDPVKSIHSRLPSPATRSQSPSIRNLDQKSVVRQRLAEIEHTASRSNSPETLTEKSTRGRQIIRNLSDSPVSGPGKRSVLLRHGTCTTVGGDSVVESFTETRQNLARSTYSQRLVSIPSGESLRQGDNPWSIQSRLTTPEPLRSSNISSAASQYSNDSAAIQHVASVPTQQGDTDKPLPALVTSPKASQTAHVAQPSSCTTPIRTPSEEARSTRSLSIFSPTSRFSQDTVAKEQANTALDQLLDVERTMSTAQVHAELADSTPLASPLDAPSPVDQKFIQGICSPSSVQNSRRRKSIFSPSSRLSTDAAPAESPEVSRADAELSVHALPITSRPSQQGQAEQDQKASCVISSAARVPAETVSSYQVPPTTLSVFSPRWQDSDMTSVAETESTAALFSRFANFSKVLPFAGEQAPIQEHSELPLARDTSGDKERDVRLTGIEEKIYTVQADLRKLPEQLSAVVAEHSASVTQRDAYSAQGVETKHLLQDIDATVKRIEDHGERYAQSLTGVHAKVDALLSLKSKEDASLTIPGLPSISGLPNVSSSAAVNASAIMCKLEEMREELKTELPMLARKLEEIQAQKASSAAASTTLLDTAPSDKLVGVPSSPSSVVQSSANGDAIHVKLDEMLAAIQARASAPNEGGKTSHNEEPDPMLPQILDLLKSDKEERVKVIEQQADSARYLNELNTWLETFVSHGTSQIESVVAGVQQLCTELGPMQTMGEDGQPVQQSSLLSNVRQLLQDSKERDDNVMALHGSVNGLMVAVQDDLRQGADLRNGLNHDALVGLIERQRHDQEQMLRALAHELSDDIRGERLRFVEAMKEATTINVQIHVEEFKKELTREVLLMTQEVARLHRERQGLEQQIADLFAFYAKQKQNSSGEPKKKGRPSQQRPQDAYFGIPAVMGPAGGSRRPLPNPAQPAM